MRVVEKVARVIDPGIWAIRDAELNPNADLGFAAAIRLEISLQKAKRIVDET